MEELVTRMMARTETDHDTATAALHILLNLLRNECSAEVFDKVLATIPGAREALPEPEAKGIAGSVMSMFGSTGGVMAAMTNLTSLGLGMSQIQDVARESMHHLRDTGGQELVEEVTGAIPQLQMFV